MDKFNILPTDRRFLDLEEEQKEAIFLGLNDMPDLAVMKRIITINTQIEEVKGKNPLDLVPKDRIRTMRTVFKKQNMSNEQIELEIKKYAATLKKAEIEKLEKGKFNNV